MRRIVPLLLIVIVGFMNGRAEAARIALNGFGSQGAIVWDGDGDVSTMANDCGAGSLCETSVYAPGFGILVTTEDAGGVAGLNIIAIHLLLSVSELPASCGPESEPACGPLSGFADLLSDNGWTVPGVGGEPDVAGDLQPIIRLLMQATGDPGFYALTQTSQTFLTTLDPTVLATSHVGVDVTTPSPAAGIPFAVQTAAPQPVPEPGTLLLLGTGMAMVLRARRRILR